jgi:AcrB/AcrD/AcrF family
MLYLPGKSGSWEPRKLPESQNSARLLYHPFPHQRAYWEPHGAPGEHRQSQRCDARRDQPAGPHLCHLSRAGAVLAGDQALYGRGPLTVEASSPDEAQQPEQATLTFVDNAVDAATGTIRLKGTFRNDAKRLWPGQFVNVMLTLTTQPNAIVVPSQAVQAGQEGQYVFVVKPDLTADQPILYLALSAPTLPLSTVDEYAETLIAQRISMVSGVAQVQVFGAQKDAVRVHFDPHALATRGIGIDEAVSALQAGNVNLPTGTLGARQVSTIYAPNNAYKVIVELEPQYQLDPTALSMLYILRNLLCVPCDTASQPQPHCGASHETRSLPPSATDAWAILS